MRYPVPNEAQAEILRRNDIDPDNCFVRFADKDCLVIQKFKTGDEIMVRENVNVRSRRGMGL